MFLHENPTSDVAGEWVGLAIGVRFDWAAGGAVAGVAEAADGFAGGAQGRQGDAYVDDSGEDDGAAEGAVSGKDGGVPECCGDFEGMWDGGGRSYGAGGFRKGEEGVVEETYCEFYRHFVYRA
jgi:hypothetical protein